MERDRVGAALTRFVRDDHAVAELVTDHWLYIVGEVCHQERVGSASWRHRLSSSVDRLCQEPVAVKVQPACRHGMAKRCRLGRGEDWVTKQRKAACAAVPPVSAVHLRC